MFYDMINKFLCWMYPFDKFYKLPIWVRAGGLQKVMNGHLEYRGQFPNVHFPNLRKKGKI
jgi:hypothetical protein